MKMGNMNEISLEEVTKLEPGQILADSVRQWRSDCQAGQFKIGASHFRGPKIDMELIGAQISEGEVLGYPLGKMIRAHMCKRASRASGNGYFAVEFEVVSDGKYADAIAQFRQQHYSPAMFRALTATPALENGNGNSK